MSLQNWSKKKDKDYTVFTDEKLFDAQDIISKELKEREGKSMLDSPWRQIKVHSSSSHRDWLNLDRFQMMYPGHMYMLWW